MRLEHPPLPELRAAAEMRCAALENAEFEPNIAQVSLAARDASGRANAMRLLRFEVGFALVAAPAAPLAAAMGSWVLAAIFAVAALPGPALYRRARSLEEAESSCAFVLDKRWIGALTEALIWPSARVRAYARRRLPALLMAATSAELAGLTEEQRGILTARLSPMSAFRHPALTAAIVSAMPTLRDEDAIRPISRLAFERWLSPGIAAVRQAARVALPALESCVLRDRQEAASAAAVEAVEAVGRTRNVSQLETPLAQCGGEVSAAPAETGESVAVGAPVADPENDGVEAPALRRALLAASWCVITPYMAFGAWYFINGRSWLPAGIAASLCVGSTQLYRLTLRSKHRDYVQDLVERDDVQYIGELTDALAWPDAGIRKICLRALTRLLPRLQATDTALLNARQRETLYSLLRIANARLHLDLMVALLRALEQVGDEAAVPHVQRLADLTPNTRREQAVQRAAQNCLPFLREIASQNRDSQTLLRASAASSPVPNMLLRPAEATHDVDTDNLLRPAAS